MVQHQKTRQSTKTDTPSDVDQVPEKVDETKLDASTADILDELDEVLEEMGEDFALQYVQRGGE